MLTIHLVGCWSRLRQHCSEDYRRRELLSICVVCSSITLNKNNCPGSTRNRREDDIPKWYKKVGFTMTEVIRKDQIGNEHIQGTTSVTQASKNITERRLNWYGNDEEI